MDTYNMKSRMAIFLSGRFSSRVNYIFEIYRLAVKLDLMGFIKKTGDGSIEIETEATGEMQRNFINSLKGLVKDPDLNINIENKDNLLNYNEFRIINH